MKIIKVCIVAALLSNVAVHAEELPITLKLGVALAVGGASGCLVTQAGNIAGTIGGLAAGTAATIVCKNAIDGITCCQEVSPNVAWGASLLVGGLAGYATAQIIKMTSKINGVIVGAAGTVATYRMLQNVEQP